MELKIWKPAHYYGDADIKGARRKTIELHPGYTALVGPNGSGKSTFLKQIREFCEEKDFQYIYYDNLSDGGSGSMQRALASSDLQFLSMMAFSSEGEGIYANMGALASRIGKMCHKYRFDDKPKFVLIDGLDSGLSIDRITVVRKDLIDYIISTEKREGNENLYIICTANNYELAKDAYQLNVITGKQINLDSYNKFYKFIIRNSAFKEELTNEPKKTLSKGKATKSGSKKTANCTEN